MQQTLNKRNYEVWFELFGKKMKTSVLATDVQDAKQQVQEKIVFHKVQAKGKDDFNKAMNLVDQIIDCFKGSKT